MHIAGSERNGCNLQNCWLTHKTDGYS